jgi:LDH2 family malate/lactate/ureidoglycolate dehydrogenase
MYPGEPEARTEAERRRQGIFVEEETWDQIAQAARDLGVAVPAV